MLVHSNENGASMIKVTLWLAILAIVIQTGITVGMEYVNAARMQDEMQIKASVAQVLKDDEILSSLTAKAKELGLPIGAEDISVQRDELNKTMKISTQWDSEVHFLFGAYVRTFHFAPLAEVNYGIGTKKVF